MSAFVLDTDILTLAREGHADVCARMLAHKTEVATTVITVEEMLSGWYTVLRKARKPTKLLLAYAELAESVQFLSGFPILTFNASALGRLDQLYRMKLHVRAADLRIAAIVLEHDATLVTRNVKDFQRVPGLKMENWAE